jgi:outer membrane protein insertion porin family
MTLLMGLTLIWASVAPAISMSGQEPGGSSPQSSPFEAVPAPLKSPPAKIAGPAIVAVEFRGATRNSPAALRVLISSRAGGPCDPETLRRDAEALNRSGRFSYVAWEVEESRSGPIVRFVVVEKPVIRGIEFRGSNAVTVPEILERFALRRVSIREETLLQEEELARAAAAVRELMAERGHEHIAVSTAVEPIWPASGVQKWPPPAVKIIFRAEVRP